MFRKIAACLGLVFFLAGVYWLVVELRSPLQPYPGQISGGWLKVVSFISWVWAVLSLLSLLGMLIMTRDDTRELQIVATALWLMWLVPCAIDAFSTPARVFQGSWFQILSYGAFVFGVPSMILADLEEPESSSTATGGMNNG